MSVRDTGKNIPACSHECTCECHRVEGMVHVGACCVNCSYCGRHIDILKLEEHLEVCHKMKKR